MKLARKLVGTLLLASLATGALAIRNIATSECDLCFFNCNRLTLFVPLSNDNADFQFKV